MPDKDHAIWDTLDSLPPFRAYDPGEPGPPQHARARTAIVESPPAPEVLRAELTRRRIYWRTTPRAPRDLMSPGRERLARILPWFATPAAVLVLLALIAAGISTLRSPSTRNMGATLIIVPSVLLMLLIFELQKARAARRARQDHCPDCDYDLSAAPSELDPAVYGVETGPRRCSECGALWPLIPPAIPPGS